MDSDHCLSALAFLLHLPKVHLYTILTFPSVYLCAFLVGGRPLKPVELHMPISPYRALASAGFVWGSLIILLAFGSFIESCDSGPRVASQSTVASAVEPLLPQPPATP